MKVEAQDAFGKWYVAKSSRRIRHVEQWEIKVSSSRYGDTRKKRQKVFAIGDRVQAKWEDGRMYFGRVLQVYPDSVHVAFDDGVEHTTPIASVRKRKEEKVSEGCIATPVKRARVHPVKRHNPPGSPPSSPITNPKRVRPPTQQYLNDSTDGESDVEDDSLEDHRNTTPGDTPEPMAALVVTQERRPKRGRPRGRKVVKNESLEKVVYMESCTVVPATEHDLMVPVEAKEPCSWRTERVCTDQSLAAGGQREVCTDQSLAAGGQREVCTDQSLAAGGQREVCTDLPTPRRQRRKTAAVDNTPREPYRLRQGGKVKDASEESPALYGEGSSAPSSHVEAPTLVPGLPDIVAEPRPSLATDNSAQASLSPPLATIEGDSQVMTSSEMTSSEMTSFEAVERKDEATSSVPECWRDGGSGEEE
eukprot:Em0617g4a